MSEIYRDRSEGAAAKRQELLRRRRDELVTMPHAVRRVVVARSARIAAGIAVTLAGVGLLVVAASTKVAGALAGIMPGIQPAPISTMVAGMWIVGVVAWAVSRARVEHRFAVAMSKYVLPSEDVDQDVERLDHEHPDEMARHMAHRLEVGSAAWPIVAAAMILPATALYVARGLATKGWPVMSEYEQTLAAHSTALIAISCAGLVGAIVMTRRSGRLPVVAPIAGTLGLIAAIVTIGLFTRHAAVGWWFAGASVLGIAAAYISRKLHVERTLIAAEDPAAGSELFTIRGFIRSLREAGSSAMATVRRLPRYKWLRTIAIVGVGIGVAKLTLLRSHKSDEAQAATQPTMAMPHVTQVTPKSFDAPYTWKHVGSRIEIDINLDGAPVEIPSIAELDMVPHGWHAQIAVELGGTDASLSIGMLGADKTPPTLFDAANFRGTFSVDACTDEPQPLGLRVSSTTKSDKPQHVVLYVVPDLTAATCTP